MAQVSPQHIQPLTTGFVALLVLALVGMGIANHTLNRS